MRNLYLIRHGKPQYPDEHSYCIGQTDFSLSMLGHLQSVLLHGELDDKITAVYCSPLSRAMETAAHITPDLPHKMCIRDRPDAVFHEMIQEHPYQPPVHDLPMQHTS